MKALIVDIEGKYAVAMTKKGTFIKVKNSDKYTVGYEADLPSGLFANVKLMAGAASAALFLLAVGLGIFLYTNPYSYINIDINPSVQITANIFDRIIKVTALNDDAEKIIEDLSIKNKILDQGIEQVVSNAVKNGYLKDEKTNAIMLTVTSANSRKNKKLQEKVSVVVEKKIKSDKINSEVLIEEVNDKSRNEALKQGVSPGKLKLVQKLIGLDPSQKAEDLINKPVKEILNSIRYYSKSQKPAKPDNSNNSNKNNNNTSNNKNNGNNSNDINNNNNINNNKNNNNNKNKDNNINKNSTKNNNINKNINSNNNSKKAPYTQKHSPKHMPTPSITVKPSKDKNESKDKKASGTDYDSRIETERDSKDSTDKLQPNNDKNPNNKNKNSEVVEEPKKTNDKKKTDSKKSNNTDN